MTIQKPQTARILLVVVLLLTFCISSLFAGARAPRIDSEGQFVVRNLQVLDVPDDDGSGLQIIWEPLPVEARVIAYRVYRGVSRDSLFFIGEIAVNPRMGVASETMSFLDRDFNTFVNIASPGRLRRERGQPAGSPLFRQIPRDINVLGPKLRHFNLLGVIPKDDFYFRATRVEQNGNVFAGFRTHQFPIFKKLIPGNTYYYTVVAVNERRVFFPHAEPVAGIPRDNAPEIPDPDSQNPAFFPVFVRDVNALQFEWGQPMYRDDLAAFDIYAVVDTTAFKNWRNALLERRYENNQNKHAENWREIRSSNIPATRILSLRLASPPMTVAYATIENNRMLDANGEVVYTFSRCPSLYSFVLSYRDFAGYTSYSVARIPNVVDSSQLPVIGAIEIFDKPDDKGDYLMLNWGKPFARITSVTYLNDERTYIQMGYEFSTNDNYRIRNIYFEISDRYGELIAEVNEFFLDKVFKIRIPEGVDADVLNVKMYFRTNRDREPDRSHYLTQQLVFDEYILTLRPQRLFFQGIDVDNYNFQILKRTRFQDLFRVSKKIPFFDRETDDLVAFEASVFKGISGYCLKKGMLLVDFNIDFVWDDETGTLINTPIFSKDANMALENLQARIATYQENLDNAETDEDRNSWQARIARLTEQYESSAALLASNERLQHINSITNDRARARAIRKHREQNRRELTYKMLLSDGRGLFTIKEITVDEYGNPFFVFPIPNWFNTDKTVTLIASLLFALLVVIFIQLARKGKDLYIRPIAGIEEIDNAIGRATEMGRPILFSTGLSGIGDIATLAGLSILGHVAKKAAEYDTKILIPCRDYIVMPIAQEIVRSAHYEAGRPDSFDKNNVFFVSEAQFAYVAGVNGVMIRQKTATNFYMGMFFAESLIMTETGNATGAIQIAGTDAVTQIPFFITTCDYTLIGEELYAASSYMSRQPLMLGTLKATDYAKFIILLFLVVGTLLSSLQVTAIVDAFPSK